MSVFCDLFGPTLATKEGDAATEVALKDKVAVGIYFSAHWCPPCRGFTPQLAKHYESALKGKGLEIVFVSSDKSEEEFTSYWGEMPWLALPYAARDVKAKLSKKYKVQGIPTFVILDGATGEVITKDGRSAVDEDPSGEKFPWKPPGFWDALGTDFLKAAGSDETVAVSELQGEGKYIALYFSAHWCPPCRRFTPELVTYYKEHLKGKNCEVIFVSSDRDEAAFKEYFGEMPWLAIPHGDKRKDVLSKHFEVGGIPTFVVVDAATGETITTEARGDVGGDPTCAEFPWRPKPLNDMLTKMGDINGELSLCVMMEGCDAKTSAAAVDVLKPIAEAAKAAGDSTLFLYASATGGPTPQIRKLCSLGEPSATPTMVLMDIPDEGGFYVADATEVTAESVNGFLAAYRAGTLTRKQLG